MECWYNTIRYGVWRSLVARTAGGREVAGSNPVAPIFSISISILYYYLSIFLLNSFPFYNLMDFTLLLR